MSASRTEHAVRKFAISHQLQQAALFVHRDGGDSLPFSRFPRLEFAIHCCVVCAHAPSACNQHQL